MIKPKKSKVLSHIEEDLTRITVILKDKYEFGNLIIETLDGEHNVQEDGKIVKRWMIEFPKEVFSLIVEQYS